MVGKTYLIFFNVRQRTQRLVKKKDTEQGCNFGPFAEQ